MKMTRGGNGWLVNAWLACWILLACLITVQGGFFMHKIVTAALLANAMNGGNRYLALPIPIPIPVKAGGNTIIALSSPARTPTVIPLGGGCNGGGYNCQGGGGYGW